MQFGKPEDVVVECSEVLNAPPESVWRTLRRVQAITLPEGIIEVAPQGANNDAVPPEQGRSMEQRVMEINDVLMLLKLEMTTGKNVPWSSYEAHLRVAPFGANGATATITCLATPTSDRQSVEGLLKAMILLSLRALKRRLEDT